uniref:Uncharacterized protein LOC102800791 n=1 Tax=Saccoglossus kowalevskii TaxID=10224 RepID=A0ABM0MS68_SACKO|nr:PREDICTED: uncharacterized protein LOC102800791 [Saccoglossus kowalevskii]
MPLITRCLCWDDLRSGAQATAIYTVVFSLIGIFIFIYYLSFYGSKMEDDSTAAIIYKLWFVMVFVYALVFIVAVILMVGVQNDQKNLLLPYLFYMVFYMFADAGVNAYVYIVGGSTSINVFNLSLCVVREAITFWCELCIFSLYQLLISAENARAKDAMSRECQVSTITLNDKLCVSPEKLPDTGQRGRSYNQQKNCKFNSGPNQNDVFDELFRPRSALSARDVRLLSTPTPSPSLQFDFGSTGSMRSGVEGQEQLEPPVTPDTKSRRKYDIGQSARNSKQVNVEVHQGHYRELDTVGLLEMEEFSDETSYGGTVFSSDSDQSSTNEDLADLKRTMDALTQRMRLVSCGARGVTKSIENIAKEQQILQGEIYELRDTRGRIVTPYKAGERGRIRDSETLNEGIVSNVYMGRTSTPTNGRRINWEEMWSSKL